MNEAERYRLQQALTEVLGAEPSETLMANLPPVPWTDLATKSDLARFAEEITTGLRTEMGEVRTGLRTEMVEARTDLRTEMADLRADMADLRTGVRTEMADLRIEMAGLRTEMITGFAAVRIELHDELRANTWRLITAMGVFTGVLAAVSRLG